MGDKMRVCRAALHMWEEPPISGKNGAGAIFFAGCPLGCVFCQNREISRPENPDITGTEVSREKLGEIMLRLADSGAECIDLVSPTQFTPQIIEALGDVKHKLKIPVVWNTGGYERVETIEALDGLADVYLPDFKFYSPMIAEEYASCGDYFETARAAIQAMVRQRGAIRFDDNGIAQSGVIVRHLVLPSHRKESIKIMQTLACDYPNGEIRISLMRQFTPNGEHGISGELDRHITGFEYQSVADEALRLGLNGYTQESGSADIRFLPKFDGTGVI